MDVTTAEEARIAEEAGAVGVMALERVPADIRRDGGVARMSDPAMIKAIRAAVSIPVLAKCRVGHFVEAQVLEALEVDYIDESEVRRGEKEEELFVEAGRGRIGGWRGGGGPDARTPAPSLTRRGRERGSERARARQLSRASSGAVAVCWLARA